MDSKSLFLTANTSTLYAFPDLDLKRDGPTVVEVPDNLLGAANDSYFRYVNDLMKAGKYLYLPPGYEGKVPGGYTVLKPKTYRLWIFLRASIADGVDKAAKLVKGGLKIYPLAKVKNPPAMKFEETDTILPLTSATSVVSVRGLTEPCEVTAKLRDSTRAGIASMISAWLEVSLRSGRLPLATATIATTTTTDRPIKARGSMKRKNLRMRISLFSRDPGGAMDF